MPFLTQEEYSENPTYPPMFPVKRGPDMRMMAKKKLIAKKERSKHSMKLHELVDFEAEEEGRKHTILTPESDEESLASDDSLNDFIDDEKENSDWEIEFSNSQYDTKNPKENIFITEIMKKYC